jgi:predicted ATPase/class 3 adenylate cyclase
MDLPTGTVTFLFTDIEGSTRLLQELGERYRPVQDDHMRLMRAAIANGDGTEIRTEGDSFFSVFPTASGAVRAAVEAQRSFASHPWPHGRALRTRMGMHSGEGRLGGGDYLGIDVNKAARIAASGHGGQVLLSDATRSLVADSLPPGTAFRHLGAHRLKDFDEPQAIYQLVIDGLPADFPPLKTLETQTNLPTELTSFVGREREMKEIKDLLQSSRLVTLSGPGGSGKTRLALRVAADLLDRFPDGVFLVELASVTETHLVPSVIAAAVGTGEMGPRSVMETLQIELRHRTALLVVDNFEQVIDAAPVVGTLLAAAPGLRFLVTSRGPLKIQAEQDYPVPPLTLPAQDGIAVPDDVFRHEAPALFLERARALDPRFTVDEESVRAILEICRRLDGLPLAIELAASRLRLMTPIGMLERLGRALPLLSGGARDLPDRQRTLRGAIGWSHDLLPPATAALFRRVCVFAGGFSLDAVPAVCDPHGELRVDALDGLEALLDTALVHRKLGPAEAERFDTLQTVREFGWERMEEEGDVADVRRRHAAYFLEMAETAAPGFRGPDLERHLRQLHIEHDNLRAALGWALELDEGHVGLRLVSALWRFWHLHGDLTSGRRWADQALALPSARGRTSARAHAFLAAGSLAYWQLDPRQAASSYEEALAIFSALGDEAGIAEATYDVAFGLALQRRAAESVEMFRASRAMFDALGNRGGVGDSLFGLCIASRLVGDIETARSAGEEGLRIHEDLGDRFGVYGSLYAVGRAAAVQGDPEAARGYFLRALAMAEGLGDRTGMALSLDNLADLEISRNHPGRAMRLAGASQTLKESIGGQAPPELVDLLDARERARGSLTDEEVERAWEQGRVMSLEEALALGREQS